MRKYRRILAVVFVVAFLVALVPTAWAAQEAININKATVKELVTLKGIGTKTAERIMQYRSDHGPFAKAEDIMNVKGVGQKTYDQNKDRITVK